MAQHNDFGKWGEDLAVHYLSEKGYAILERDWRYGHKDIDIIAISDDTLVFVEVKTRRNDTFMRPEQSVDWKKIKNITLAANHYVRMNGIDLQIRFDIISIVAKGTDGKCSIDHIESAFLPYYFR